MLIKTNKDLKLQAQKVSSELGVPLSTVINALLKQFVRDQEVVLSAVSYKITPYLEELIKEGRAEYKEHRKTLSASEFLTHLKSL